MLLARISNIPYRHISCMFYCSRLFTTRCLNYENRTKRKHKRKKRKKNIPAAYDHVIGCIQLTAKNKSTEKFSITDDY